MSIEKKTSPGVGDVDVKLEVAQRLERSAAAQAAFRELERDAPTGEGPIVRKVKALLTPEPARDAAESDRKEHVARAPIHTNPLPEPLPEAKVLRKPRPELDAVTLPDLRKKEALAPMAVPTGGRAIAGTLRLAVPAALAPANAPASPVVDEPSRTASAGQSGDDTAGDATAHQRSRRRLTALVALTLFAVVCALVLWLVARVREQERENLARESAEAAARTVPVTATAKDTASAPTAPSSAVVIQPAETAQSGVKGAASDTARPRSSVPAPAVRGSEPAASASTRPSAKALPSVPASAPTSTGTGGWIE